MTACAGVLMSSCQKSTPAKKGVPMTIQASVVAPSGTKTLYDYTADKTLEGYWEEEEAITVVSFNENGITAVDRFVSYGEEGRKKADFDGTWTGNEGDRIICLYPDLDSYAGVSIFENVYVGSQQIYMRDLCTASSSLPNDDTGSVSDVDLMLGEVKISNGIARVYLEHQIAVFRIEATLENLPFFATDNSPYDNASISTLRIKCVDPNSEMDEWGPIADPVFVKKSCLDVNTNDYDLYNGKPHTVEKGPLNYYLLTTGIHGDFYMNGRDPVTKTFFVPVRFDHDLEAGYKLCFQFGGYYWDYGKNDWEDIVAFPVGDKQKTITSTLPLENGKVYCFKVTI